MTSIESFVNRLKKIGVEVELFSNYPWLYLVKVNGVRVPDKHVSNHGFTIFMRPTKKFEKDRITNISEIFKVIRKTLENDKNNSIL